MLVKEKKIAVLKVLMDFVLNYLFSDFCTCIFRHL